MINQLFNLKGRTALVTGSSRGIGRAIAMLLGEAGAQIRFHASKPSARLDDTLAEAKGKGIDCESVAADLSTPEGIETIVQTVRETDILILNASVQAYRTLTEFDPEEFAREFNTNVRSSFALVKAFLPGMAKRGFGRIITIGSVNQWKQSPRLCIYASTKSAQVNMIMNCARSYAKFGITANNIAPGVIATDRNKAALDDPAMAEMIMKQIPAARFGTAEDCAGLALLLCSDAGSYITGADIPVAGGMQL